MARNELLQGTLDLLILKTLARGTMHGWGISQHIQKVSDQFLTVEEGSLYPALHRMELKGWIESEWGDSENNRRAKYYRLTKEGKKQLETEMVGWERMCCAIAQVLQGT